MTVTCVNHHGLPRLATCLLSVTPTTADTERLFSDFGITHTRHRNRLNPETVHKSAVVRMSLRRSHAARGFIPRRLKRKLTADGSSYEPSRPDLSITGVPSSDLSSDLAEDTGMDPSDFQQLSEGLVKAAIDSRANMEEDDDDDDEGVGNGKQAEGAGAGEGAEGRSERAAGGPPYTGRSPSKTAPNAAPSALTSGGGDSARDRSTPDSQSRPQIRPKKSMKAIKTSLPLADLFLFPTTAPSEAASDANGPGSSEGDRVRRLQFIWTQGRMSLQRESRVSELLQPGGC